MFHSKLSDRPFWSKADVLSMTGMSYSRQMEFARKIGFEPIKQGRVEHFKTRDVIRLLEAGGFKRHILNGEKVLLNGKVIKL